MEPIVHELSTRYPQVPLEVVNSTRQYNKYLQYQKEYEIQYNPTVLVIDKEGAALIRQRYSKDLNELKANIEDALIKAGR